MDSEGRLNDDAKLTKGGVKGQGSREGGRTTGVSVRVSVVARRVSR